MSSDISSGQIPDGPNRQLSQLAVEKMMKHFAADLFDNVQHALNELSDQGQEYQTELGVLRQEQKEIDKKHRSTDERLQDVENFISEELEKTRTSILDNTNKITALEGLTSKCSQACDCPGILLDKLELAQERLSALEERFSDSKNEGDDRGVIAYKTLKTRDINALNEARQNEFSYLNDRLQALTEHLNNVQSSVNAIEAWNAAREDEVLYLGHHVQDLATKLNDVEMLHSKPTHQSLFEEIFDDQQLAQNIRHDNIVTASTASLIAEIPELSGHVLGYPRSVTPSQIQRDCDHYSSDVVLTASLFAEEDIDLIGGYVDTGNCSHESPQQELLGLSETHNVIDDLDPEADPEDAPQPRRFSRLQAVRVVSTFVRLIMRIVVTPTTAFVSRMRGSDPFWQGGHAYALDIACSFLRRLLDSVELYFIMHALPFSQISWTRFQTRWLSSLCAALFQAIGSPVASASRPSCWRLYFLLSRSAQSFLTPFWSLPPCATFFLQTMSSAMSRSLYRHLYFFILPSAQSFIALFWPLPLATFFPSIMTSALSQSSYRRLYLFLQSTQYFLALFCKFNNWTWKWHFLWALFFGAMTYYHMQGWEEAALRDLHGAMLPRHLRRRFQPT